MPEELWFNILVPYPLLYHCSRPEKNAGFLFLSFICFLFSLNSGWQDCYGIICEKKWHKLLRELKEKKCLQTSYLFATVFPNSRGRKQQLVFEPWSTAEASFCLSSGFLNGSTTSYTWSSLFWSSKIIPHCRKLKKHPHSRSLKG